MKRNQKLTIDCAKFYIYKLANYTKTKKNQKETKKLKTN